METQGVVFLQNEEHEAGSWAGDSQVGSYGKLHALLAQTPFIALSEFVPK